ncbi:hypothetical protein RCCS2_17791 [Roseobacter sp. CCS2]|nr:hypothetical protein RCCS2_17791 [Roseobacter sp. CCS2]
MPLSALEVQAILGLSSDNYDAVVSAGLLRKGVHFVERQSTRTSLHNFHDLLHLVLWSHLERWAGILDQEDLCLILDQVETARVRGVNVDPDVTVSYEPFRRKAVGLDAEIQDELERVTLEIDDIWCSLVKSIRYELAKEVQPPHTLLSAKQSYSIQAVLRSNTTLTQCTIVHL